MKKFKLIYNLISKANDVFVEAHKKGLIARYSIEEPNLYFYDSKTKVENKEFKEKHTREMKMYCDNINLPSLIDRLGDEKLDKEFMLTAVIYPLLHPIKFLRGGLAVYENRFNFGFKI